MSLVNEIMTEINTVMNQVDETQLEASVRYFNQQKRIFVLGAGRSGFQAKGFAMRLMHLGYSVYVMGETITPSVQASDVWVAISGSGTTSSIISETKRAKKLGLTIIALTSEPASPLAELADCLIIVPGATKTGSGVASIQLLSSLFDQTVHITLDILTLLIARQKNISNQDAYSQHANLE